MVSAVGMDFIKKRKFSAGFKGIVTLQQSVLEILQA